MATKSWFKSKSMWAAIALTAVNVVAPKVIDPATAEAAAQIVNVAAGPIFAFLRLITNKPLGKEQ